MAGKNRLGIVAADFPFCVFIYGNHAAEIEIIAWKGKNKR